MYFRWCMYALLGCQKGELSASDNLINSYLCIHWFFEKVKSRFPTVFQRTSCTLQHSFEVQSTIKSTQYIQKYINVLLDVLCTLFPFLVEKILIPTCQCTFGCTLYFQKWKYKVHPKVQSTSKSTKYTTHACFNQFLRIRLQQKKESSSNQLWCVGNHYFDLSQNFIWEGRSAINALKTIIAYTFFVWVLVLVLEYICSLKSSSLSSQFPWT